MAANTYKVFVSHGSEDSWIASQIANCIRTRGAHPFLDLANIPKGGDVRKIIRAEIAQSRELVVLFTPWSCQRSWVWIEMGAAWVQELPVIAVFYGMELGDLETNGQGKGILEDTNVLNLNDIETYFTELASRVNGASHA
jgi:hypothetical protein